MPSLSIVLEELGWENQACRRIWACPSSQHTEGMMEEGHRKKWLPNEYYIENIHNAYMLDFQI